MEWQGNKKNQWKVYLGTEPVSNRTTKQEVLLNKRTVNEETHQHEVQSKKFQTISIIKQNNNKQ